MRTNPFRVLAPSGQSPKLASLDLVGLPGLPDLPRACRAYRAYQTYRAYRPTIETFEGGAKIQRSPPAQKTTILPRKLTGFENRMPAKGTGREYHFANLSFRLRETTTFEKKQALCKIWSRRKVPNNNLGRTSGKAFSQAGRVNGPSGHFFLRTSAAKSHFIFCLGCLQSAGEPRVEPQHCAPAPSPSDKLMMSSSRRT